jgi:hypothetical protein
MRAQELEARADAQGIPREALCLAADVLRPVMEEALEQASRWRWVQRAGLRAVLRLLREYQARNCAEREGLP